MNKTIKCILMILFLFCLGMFVTGEIQKQRAQDAYEKAQELARETETEPVETEAPTEESIEETTEAPTEESKPEVWQAKEMEEDEYMKALASKDLEPLREVNPEVLGWIWIPGTQVDYPIMDGDDNDYYLEHTWDREPSLAGSICIEMLNSPDLSDFNTLIYGHRMKNDSMFGSLKYYKDEEYWKEHPYVYVMDDNGVYRYEVFAAHTAPVDSAAFSYGFLREEKMQDFLDYCLEASVLKTGIVPTLDDKILTLVTCTGRGYEARWIVQARMEGVEDNPRKLYVLPTEAPETVTSSETDKTNN